MRDSVFYTDEELEEYEGYIDQVDSSEMELFLQKCHDLEIKIISLSTSLNEDALNNLNISEDINVYITTIKELKEYKNGLNLSNEDKFKANQVFDKLKKDFVTLKNKHIHLYNTKVEYINGRINDLTTRLDKDELSKTVIGLLNKLNIVDKCDVYIDGKWDQNEYLKTMDFDKLINLYSTVEEIERILKISIDEPLELFSSVNYVNNEVRRIRREMKSELSLSSVNSNLDKCVTLLERVTDLDIKHELLRERISKEMFSKYSAKIKKLRSDIKDVEEQLLNTKIGLIRKSNYYAVLFNKLEQVSGKYDVLYQKTLEYEGKCTSKAVAVFNDYLKTLTNYLFAIQTKIKEYDEEGLLNSEQKNNIYNKLCLIAEKHQQIKIKVDDQPVLLKEEEKEEYIENKFTKFEKMLGELDREVSKLEGPIKDKDLRKKMNSLFKDMGSRLDGFDSLLSYYKINEPENYEATKIEVDKLKDKFNSIGDKYYSKCSLKVKAVRSIKKVYKEHNKLGLISAGLSALALLSSVNSLIPAIMQGNVVIANSVPALKGMMGIFNKILGGVIGAKSTIYGGWKLANGVLLNANVAATSLLKSLASFSAGTVAFISPMFIPQLILKIKALVEKIKTYELKQKLVQNYEKGKGRYEEVKEKIDSKKEEKDIKLYYENLYNEYCDNEKMSLDEFCLKNKLSDEDKRILELMEEEKILKDKRQQELRRILKENTGRRR